MKRIRLVGLSALVLLWAALTAAAWFGPAKDFSDTERRKLAQFPKLTVQTVLDGKFMPEFETFTLDQFPLRDTFRRVKALFHYNALGQKDNNEIYLVDGYAAKLEYPMNRTSVDYALKKFNNLYEKYLSESERIIFAAVPDKGYYLAEANGYPAMDYDALFTAVEEGAPWAEFVDLTDLLGPEDYYFTDTHWRQEQILDVAERLCGALGAESFGEGELTREKVDEPFYGVYYGQAALPVDPEDLYVMTGDVLDQCTVYNQETGNRTGVYDWEKLNSRDLYDIYLSGAAALLTIENPNAKTDRELVVFRDSFGSSLTPLLVKDYKTVTVVDIRYLASDYVGSFVDFHGQDVLFLYSTLILNGSTTLK